MQRTEIQVLPYAEQKFRLHKKSQSDISEINCVYCKTRRNTQMHSVGKVHISWVSKQVIHGIAAELW